MWCSRFPLSYSDVAFTRGGSCVPLHWKWCQCSCGSATWRRGFTGPQGTLLFLALEHGMSRAWELPVHDGDMLCHYIPSFARHTSRVTYAWVSGMGEHYSLSILLWWVEHHRFCFVCYMWQTICIIWLVCLLCREMQIHARLLGLYCCVLCPLFLEYNRDPTEGDIQNLPVLTILIVMLFFHGCNENKCFFLRLNKNYLCEPQYVCNMWAGLAWPPW